MISFLTINKSASSTKVANHLVAIFIFITFASQTCFTFHLQKTYRGLDDTTGLWVNVIILFAVTHPHRVFAATQYHQDGTSYAIKI